MKLNLDLIAYHLSSQHIHHVANETDMALRGFRFLSKEPFSDDILYLADWKELKKLNVLPKYFVCTGSNELLLNTSFNGATGYILLPQNTSLTAVSNQINSVFEFYNQMEQELFKAIMDDADIQSILILVEKLMGHPVMLFDAALRLIAFSSTFNTSTNDIYTETLLTGFSSPQLMSVLKENDVLNQLATSRKALYINIPSVTPFLNTNIFMENERVASLSVHSPESNINQCLLPLLDYLTSILTTMLKRQNASGYLRSSNIQKMVMDMLKGISIDREVIQRNISPLKWEIKDEYQVIRIQMDPRDIDGGTVKYNCELLRNIFYDSIVMSLENVLFLLLHRSNHRDIDHTISERLQRFLSERNCIAGVSMPFRDLSYLNEHFILAEAAIKKGAELTPQKFLYPYESYIAHHLIDLCKEKINVRCLCHPGALAIHDYDSQFNTDLLHSLYVYLIYEKSLSIASKKLKIHRNTLVYRISKIKELFDLQLDDPQLRLHLILSYTILIRETDHPHSLLY